MASKSFSNSNVRCVTLIGHVDHGKSSYADSLLAANGIISSRMAGKVRYLDSREDEQERGITMEASAVSLAFKLRRHAALEAKGQANPTNGDAEKEGPIVEDYMINLIDTPGHVDFSSEVSTASRLCDGALVIVDVVEGVCTQTITVLRQAWSDRLRPILVINKMDRLVTELRLTPNEAYHHLQQLIEQVNAVMGSFFASERMEDDLRWREEREQRIADKKASQDAQAAAAAAADTSNSGQDEEYEDHDDEDIYFDPSRGNVIFASAIDNWAFRLERFSVLYAKKLGILESRFRKVLWGDFYFDPKNKRVMGQKQKDKEKRTLKPMFVQFVLENIWAVYDSIALNRDQEKIEKIVKTLDLKILPRDLKSKDTSVLISSIFSQWLPLAPCTFAAVVSNIPSPQEAQATRVPKLLSPDLSYFATPADLEPKNAVQADMFAARSDPADKVYNVAYISKMFAVRREDLPESKRKALTADEMRMKAKESRERARAIQAATGAAVQQAPEGVPLEEAAALQHNGSDKVEKQGEAHEAPSETKVEPISDEVAIGFSRLYSGRLRVGQSVVVVLPKYQPALGATSLLNAKHIKDIKIEALYMLMGRDLVAVNEVPAGNVFGIRGLEGVVLRNATLFAPPGNVDDLDTWLKTDYAKDVVNLSGVNSTAAPIVRVALEPKNPSDMSKLVEGLKLLNQADPCVQVLVQETGEHVIIGAGELHVERCLKDLQERFAKCEIQASPPIVPFRETAVKGNDMPPPKTEGAPRGTIVGSVANGLVSYRIRAVPMPLELTSFIGSNATSIRRLQHERRADADEESAKAAQSLDGQEGGKVLAPQQFWSTLEEKVANCGSDWKDVVEHVWSFGPRRVGPNLLLDRAGLLAKSLRARTNQRHLLADGRFSSGLQTPDEATDGYGERPQAENGQTLEEVLHSVHLGDDDAAEDKPGQVTFSSKDMNDAIEAGFQMAMLQGPMCAEPVQGMAYFVEELSVDREEAQKEGARVRLSQITGSLMSSVRESCRQALLDWSPRLMMAMYTCDIQASTEVLGKVHAVLSRRRGRITSEEMKEGTSFFTVGALLPVVESFGFADEIRKRTSGAASPQLIFAGFELFNLDPYWVPRTEEELEDLGEKGERENVAERYMNQVRKRKGMFVTKRIVEAAEKQRTLKSN
ncbi:putative translation elongation factor 2-putative [Tilletiaria anomala UBC 951]|uniref:Ribosome assembly protein 1 n=1 Tax=Tilletiaria anomala (strain ATCC 24038 / CBS 436.72 / UBC 951) TaxID=1037660 RepID=A0A066W6B0_TILAU|nr:putative translation elongation factor 2-putative [Tilletiaria anomala UBC 951]KDN46624.1 putative translation elongation factor 2-putative [Tilletiaria anomala UBC 951]